MLQFIQLRFQPGCDCLNVTFVPWQMRNDHISKCKLFYFAFIDLDKVFDKVSQ